MKCKCGRGCCCGDSGKLVIEVYRFGGCDDGSSSGDDDDVVVRVVIKEM